MALLIEAQSTLSSFFSEFGYLGPFLVLLACGFGFPVPEEITMLGSGFLLYQDKVEALPIVAVCLVATLLGDSVPYWVGRKFGRRAVAIRPIGAILHAERLGALERRFERNGARAVFVCRFLPGLRLPAWFTAGTFGMTYPRFMLVDGLGAMIMTPILVFLGYRSGAKIAELEQRFQNLHQIFGFVIVALAVGFFIHLLFGKGGAFWSRSAAGGTGAAGRSSGGPGASPGPGPDHGSGAGPHGGDQSPGVGSQAGDGDFFDGDRP